MLMQILYEGPVIHHITIYIPLYIDAVYNTHTRIYTFMHASIVNERSCLPAKPQFMLNFNGFQLCVCVHVYFKTILKTWMFIHGDGDRDAVE